MDDGALQKWRDCEACGARMPVQDLVRTWCDACGWNLSEAEPPRNLVDRKIDALGELHGAWLLDRVITAPESELRPRFRMSTLAAFAISLLIMAANLVVGLA